MSRMSWRAVPGPEGPALLAARGRDAALGTVVVVLTVGVFAAVGDHGTLTSIQRLDDAWLRLMISGRRWWNLAAFTAAVVPSGRRRAWWTVAAALMVGQIQRRVEGRQGAA
jgi:hypothetical protein